MDDELALRLWSYQPLFWLHFVPGHFILAAIPWLISPAIAFAIPSTSASHGQCKSRRTRACAASLCL